MERLTELRGIVAYLQAELQTIHEGASERSLTPEETERFNDGVWLRDACIAEGIDLEARERVLASVTAGSLESSDSVRSVAEAAPAFHNRDRNPYDPEYRRSVGDLEAAKRAIGDDDRMDERAKEAASKRLALSGLPEMREFPRHVLAFGSPEYARAFGKASLGQEAEMTPAEREAWQYGRAESRAMGLTDAAGGYTIPTFLDPTIIDTRDGTINPMRAISTVVQVTGDNWNGVTSAGVSVAYGTEFAVATDGSPVFTQPSITPAKGMGFVPISFEGYEDITSAGSYIGQSFANARDDLDANKMILGSGTNEPKGVVTALAAQVLVQDFNATNSAVSAQDLFDIQAATGPRYRSRSSWLMNLAYINRIRALGTSDNYFSQTVRLPDAAFSELLGRPLYESSAITSVLSTTTNNWAVFGDFSNYVIVDRVGLTVEFIPNLFDPTTGRPNGSRGWLCHWRTGADVVNTTAFTLGVNPNTAYL